MQEAMLACIDITKPTFELSAQKMASQTFPMTWLCEMANSVLGENGKLLEYRHLIANPKTRATWTHSYGNECPAKQKEPTHFFHPPTHGTEGQDERYPNGLITCLIRPEK
jgi:hypothetical protein